MSVVTEDLDIDGEQDRARPGRIHHCMRTIGVAQSALNLMLERVTDPNRKTFGRYLYEHGDP